MSSQGTPGRLVDYFVICGLDVSTGLEQEKLSGENLHCPPLDRAYKAKVIANYPKSLPWNPFDQDAVTMLCMPKGLNFKTQRHPREPKFHAFLITREDGSRTYGAAYIFYEEVTNVQIQTAMQTLQAMHSAEQTKPKSSSAIYISRNEDSPVQKRRPLMKQKSRTYDMKKDKLFVTKCICLVMSVPFVKFCRQYLQQLHEAINKQNFSLALEDYVYNLLYEVPLPPLGRSMKFYGVSSPIFMQRPGQLELPLLDFSLWKLFRLLGVENVIQVFTCMLLEHQILLYSTDYHKLMLVAEGCTGLLFPYNWQHVYVPILPASLQHFLDAPVPYIMGLQHSQEEDRSQLTLTSEANVCFVDIDEHVVDVPEDLQVFPHKSELVKELAQIVSDYHPKLRSTNQNKGSPQHIKNIKNLDEVDSKTSPYRMDILQHSEAFLKISALAKKTGVWESLGDFSDSSPKKEEECEEKEPVILPTRELDELKFNNAVREIILNRFVHLFISYETFIIQPSQDMEQWLCNRETMQNFDKAAFLSDQPDGYLEFLSAFLETQMFATFIDNKVLSNWEEIDPGVKMFDERIKELKEVHDEIGTLSRSYSVCDTVEDSECLIEKRTTNIDHEVPRPCKVDIEYTPGEFVIGFFPILDKGVLNTEPVGNKPKYRETAKWRRKDRLLQHSEHIKLNSDQREKYIQEARSKSLRQPMLSELSGASMAQTNWKFVETLLKECKTKTKRMLVEKMGQEAVELGHGEGSLTGVEENTLIASLCDLLERIWSHGIQTRKGKSALWSHLLSYEEIEESNDTSKPFDPTLLSPGLSSMALDGRIQLEPIRTHRRTRSKGNIELPSLRPIPRSVIHDMRKVKQMTCIKTDVGFARAFIRLALEKKMLSAHLKELLSDSDLLRGLYKRYAFLRCEDEREQFLYHLLSLNAVDYFCFTNSFTNTVVPYKILIYPSTKFAGSTTSANPWISVAGQMAETGIIEIPKGLLEINVEHKSLGVLTTVRIGHDNSGLSPKWLVEYILVRNELTGHTYRFPCGKWLGKGIDDGSTERLLVAELLPHNIDPEIQEVMGSRCRSPPRRRSPSSPRKSIEQGMNLPDIQENLGQAVNGIVKYFYKPEKERGNLTYLLCGDMGLVNCLEQVFQCGFRSARLFRNKFYIWDYLEKVKCYFEGVLETEQRKNMFCNLIYKINNAATIGKDGKFQIFVCVAIRDHRLQRWLPLIANTPVTQQMYEEHSFLRDSVLTNFVVQILDTLNEFPITLEPSLVRGLDV